MSIARRLFTPLLLLVTAAITLGAAPAWHTDLAAARAEAAATKKPLLIDFTGSDWCPYCILLDDEVLKTPAFASWAEDYILVKLDYPRSRERTPEKIAADPRLQALMKVKEEFRVPGFPTVVVLESDGRERARVVGYERGQGPEAYLRQLAPAS